MDSRIIDINSFINYLEIKHGDLDDFFFEIFEARVDMGDLLEMFYLHDRVVKKLEIDFQEYLDRYSDLNFELILDKVKEVARTIILHVKNSPDFKSTNCWANRHKSINFPD